MTKTKPQQKHWSVKPVPPESFAKKFSHLPILTRQLLWNRNITESAIIEDFLNPDYQKHVHSPFLFRHMKQASERIEKAIASGEKITVFGDYDADGVCGAAVMCKFLKLVNANHDVFIPDRNREGFGMSLQKIRDFHETGTKVLITIDCGVTDYDEIELANSIGMDVIVLDHHVVPPKWPNAFAIIDHKHPDETYPERVLSGAGLSFKMVQALIGSGKFNVPAGWEKWLLDIVAIAAVADMVPLTGENRALVKYGLMVLRKTKHPGLRELFRLRGDNPVNADVETISHFIAPRINAASRMDHADTAFNLLTTENEEEARWLAGRLEEKNEERKRVVEDILNDLTTKLAAAKPASIIFEGSSEWPAGVLGLAATRLVEAYQRPVFLYAMNSELVKGSCRAPTGTNVMELMSKTGEFFSDFGGHTLAGGFSTIPEHLPMLKEKLELAGNEIEKTQKPAIDADAELSLDEVGEITYELVKTLEPFGQGNPRPLFIIRNAKIADLRKVGADGAHLKMKLGPRYLGAIYFKAGENNFKTGDTVDVAAELQKNTWNGVQNIELRVVDAKLAIDSY
ncbi:MAG: single-stranded-DNA-specific exonuclease RecJ [bacterium]|nr:single-stranded-DNA-specific exonuclease RecJ [bacterium]